MTAEDLTAFEDEIAALFNAGKIPYPIHLESGNEESLIDVFKDINDQDWVFTSWRGHLKALLKGVPPEALKDAIRCGESMTLRFPASRVYGSAIVGGTIPIALGVALAIKRRDGPEKVHCFLGDMTAETGIFHECQKYAGNHKLPIRWIIEDNGLSVCTDTRRVWGGHAHLWNHVKAWENTEKYEYKSKYPHAGAGKRIQF